ncbi:helix-turn-helix domain-containing protein [Vibrio diazotrophicus]|uniref:helix-turn-helix domain-containing protein n=1 Tax=Vibrio diazotrophicus TaxID=685 RepID=UPI000AFDA9EC|nr:helix-turn-helix transcriptional regulator [Vibrio diazotrophicus]
MDFSEYISLIREDIGCTQSELLDLLQNYSSSFEKLDLTTLSRWERGVTKPKTSKQILVCRALGQSIIPLIQLDSMSKDNSFNSLNKMTNRILNPYSHHEGHYHIEQYESFDSDNQYYASLNAFHQLFLGLEWFDIQDLFIKFKLNLSLVVDQSDYLMGHILYGLNDCGLSNEEYSMNNIYNMDFYPKSELTNSKKLLNVITIFSTHPLTRILVILELIKIIVENPNITHVVLTMQNEPMYEFFYRHIEHDVIHKSELSQFDGVELFGKKYRFIQIMISAEELLSNSFISQWILDIGY